MTELYFFVKHPVRNLFLFLVLTGLLGACKQRSEDKDAYAKIIESLLEDAQDVPWLKIEVVRGGGMAFHKWTAMITKLEKYYTVTLHSSQPQNFEHYQYPLEQPFALEKDTIYRIKKEDLLTLIRAEQKLDTSRMRVEHVATFIRLSTKSKTDHSTCYDSGGLYSIFKDVKLIKGNRFSR